jgi:hypothetical protein
VKTAHFLLGLIEILYDSEGKKERKKEKTGRSFLAKEVVTNYIFNGIDRKILRL